MNCKPRKENTEKKHDSFITSIYETHTDQGLLNNPLVQEHQIIGRISTGTLAIN